MLGLILSTLIVTVTVIFMQFQLPEVSVALAYIVLFPGFRGIVRDHDEVPVHFAYAIELVLISTF